MSPKNPAKKSLPNNNIFFEIAKSLSQIINLYLKNNIKMKRSKEIGGETTDKIRSPQEVAERTLALFSVVAISQGAPKNEVIEWLSETTLINTLTPKEKEYLDNPSIKESINFSWKSEALLILVWALNLIEMIPSSSSPCDISVFQEILPPFIDISEEEFIFNTKLKANNELFEVVIILQNEHAQARKLKDTKKIEILQERHHAINWIVGYCNQAWDDITTDT